MRPGLLGLDAFAVATQLDEAAASPDELAATLTALEQVLAASTASEPVAQRFASARNPALELVERPLGQDNHIVLQGWLRECSPFAQTEADVASFLAFFGAALAQYRALQSVKPAGDGAGDGM